MPRARKPANRGLPKFLYRDSKRPGYRLWNPIEGKETYLPDSKYSRAEAEQKAHEVALAVDGGSTLALANLIPEYLDYLERSGNRESTLKVKRTIMSVYINAWGKYPITAVTRRLLMEHWKAIGPHAWQKHRNIWVAFYRWAIGEGHCEVNEAERTLRPQEADLKRVTQRHTSEGIALIRAAAEPWLQIAIDVAIYSLQDRSTLLAAKREDVQETPEGLVWLCTRSKVSKHLEIAAPKGTRLYDALQRALRFEVAGSYLIRRQVRRRARSQDRAEWSQVLPNFLTKEFRSTRNASGAYSELEAGERPGFHQLRAWGSHLYQQAGYDKSYVQRLMAHEKPGTTANYQADHGTVERDSVEAGL